MKDQDKQVPNVINHFNAPIGQYVQYQHIEHMTIGSDASVQVASSPQPTPTQAPIAPIEAFANMFIIGYRERRKSEFESMLALIQEPQWKPKDNARFALAIYQSDNLIPRTKPHTFKEWYRICCETFGWEQGNYEPCKLTPNDATRKIEMYL